MTRYWVKANVEGIVRMHDKTVARYGGLPGIRDLGMLESAFGQAFQTFGGCDLYPSILEKSARLAYGIIRNHPFLDGNKRAAALAMATFLESCGYTFSPPSSELVSMMLGVSNDEVSFEELTAWAETWAAGNGALPANGDIVFKEPTPVTNAPRGLDDTCPTEEIGELEPEAFGDVRQVDER